MPVNTPLDSYTAMQAAWQLMRDVNEGRAAVLKTGKIYVPDLPGATPKENDAYRMRGSFYNALSRTVFSMTGMLFQKDIKIKFPAPLLSYLSDVTMTNVTAEMFAFTAALETTLIGRYGILVDFDNEDKRPNLSGYVAESIISWRTDDDGVLTRVVLYESYAAEDPEDPFLQKQGQQYRVLLLENGMYSQQLYRKQGDSADFTVFEEQIIPTRRGVPLPFIPFVFLGPLHVTSDIVRPPLLDLADVNLAHWRNSVDYEYGLHLLALPTPWVAGMKSKSGNGEEALSIGPAVVWELEVQGSAGMLEFTGTGLKTVSDAMEEKKVQMATLGARLMDSQKSKQQTATEVQLQHSGDTVTLHTMSIAMGQGLTIALQLMAWWTGTQALPTDTEVSVELTKDFLNVRATAQEVQTALLAVQAGEISFATFWNLLQQGGWARDGVTADEEREQIEIEKPAAAAGEVTDVMQADGSIKHADGSITMPDGTEIPAPPAPIVNQPPAPPAKKTTKTVKGADGEIKYQIEES